MLDVNSGLDGVVKGTSYPGGVAAAGTQYTDNILKRGSIGNIPVKSGSVGASLGLDMGVANSTDLTQASATAGSSRFSGKGGSITKKPVGSRFILHPGKS